jgi:hypothetical protein
MTTETPRESPRTRPYAPGDHVTVRMPRGDTRCSAVIVGWHEHDLYGPIVEVRFEDGVVRRLTAERLRPAPVETFKPAPKKRGRPRKAVV